MDEATFNSLKSAGFSVKSSVVQTSAADQTKTVADPSDAYRSLVYVWLKSRAVCNGEQFVKDFDSIIDTVNFTNLLIPFSPSMSQLQYNFYKAEAELPGITAQFSKTLVGGLLRKQPTLKLPDDVEKDAAKWLMHEFGKDDSAMSAFLDAALWEEVQTSRAWIFVDYPRIDEEMSIEDRKAIKPYPVLHRAENIINTRTRTDPNGRTVLDRVIVKGYQQRYDDDIYEFHPKYVETVWVHELTPDGKYQVRVFELEDSREAVGVQGGHTIVNNAKRPVFKLIDTIPVIINDKPVMVIPAWPLNGSVDGTIPLLTPIIDKEIALYNKISRRNHLMYGAATYTPVICSSMDDAKFDQIVSGGLGSWILLPNPEDKADVLKTPTDALQDMEKAIASGYEEIAKLGVRMLAPEHGDQSGVALEIRNAAQTAQLGSLNLKVSNTMRQVICFMLNWYYDIELKAADIDFELSSDFNPMPHGADWLRLATEWYQQGLIPRTIWLLILKQNDLLPPDYDDDEGQIEISKDESIITPKDQFNQKQSDFANQMNTKLKGKQ